MSFLNDLKKQADQLRAAQSVSGAALEANILATESACQLIFKYWVDLCKQLNVLQPASPGRYAFDNKAVFTGLGFTVDNPDGLAHWVIDVDAKALNVRALDELAKWMVGQPNAFRSVGTVSQATEF